MITTSMAETERPHAKGNLLPVIETLETENQAGVVMTGTT
jgi:hypothetical protein